MNVLKGAREKKTCDIRRTNIREAAGFWLETMRASQKAVQQHLLKMYLTTWSKNPKITCQTRILFSKEKVEIKAFSDITKVEIIHYHNRLALDEVLKRKPFSQKENSSAGKSASTQRNEEH